MTHEEAKEILIGVMKIFDDRSETNDALKIAFDALDKQIPKKPIQNDCIENIFYCQSCTRWFNGYHKPNHCYCGQALDWWG